MKKTLVIALIAISACFTAHSQVDPHAIGIRFGGGAGYGFEVSYLHGFSERNRLELDLGIGGNENYSRFGLVGAYHWDWNITQGLNWFVGPAAGIDFSSGKDNLDDYVGLAIGGQVGLEYVFDFPLQISLDFRPLFDVLADTDGFGWGFALGARYRF